MAGPAASMNDQGTRAAAGDRPAPDSARTGSSATEMSSRKPRSRPLYIELDAALIDPSAPWEAALRLLRRRPLMIGPVLLWMLRGRETLSRKLAQRSKPDAAVLPYRREVLRHLDRQHRAGRRLVLVSVSNGRLATSVAAHLGLFDDVISGHTAGAAGVEPLLEAIRADAKGRPFDFLAGDGTSPEVLRAATAVTLVGSRRPTGSPIPADLQIDRVLEPPGRRGASVIRALRVHQWTKNLLVIVPAVLAQVWSQAATMGNVILAFLLFSLMASGMYVLNDLLDLDADRRSPTRRNRSFASGRLPVTWGLIIVPALVLVGASLSFLTLGSEFGWLMIVYVLVAAAYSIELKHRMLVDVIVLAGLYTLRLLAGGAAAGVEVSSWLLAFSMFFFLSLAFAKRYNELIASDDEDARAHMSRPYDAVDATAFQVMGPTCGLLSILVLALYISSDAVLAVYAQPRVLWFLCPVLLYWVVRVWFLTLRGRLHEDPVVFALKDRASYAVAFAAVLLLFLAAR